MASAPKTPASFKPVNPGSSFTASAPQAAQPVLEAMASQAAIAKENIVQATETGIVQSKQALEQVTTQAANAQENFRKATEQGVAQGKAAYEKVKGATEDATATLETSFATATKGFTALNAKAFEALRINSEVMFDFVKALSGIKTMAEAVTLQSDVARKQYENLTAQNKELVALAQKAAMDAVEPLKAGLAKAGNTAR